jgi:hypothetical protein
MLKDYIGKPVGFVRINKPIVHTDSSYECAAWWEERTTTTGVFPLFLNVVNNNYSVQAKIPATVSDDYFPSLWGGVAISDKPYVAKNIGNKSRDVRVSADIVAAIKDTGTIPGADKDWYVNPEIWELVIKDHEQQLFNAYNALPEWWAKYQAGDDQYHSRVGMIAHFGEMLVRYPREIQELYRHHGYLNEKSPMWQELHKKNTAWINGS